MRLPTAASARRVGHQAEAAERVYAGHVVEAAHENVRIAA